MIYLDEPNLSEMDAAIVKAAVNAGEVSTRGECVDKFEQAMAGFLGVSDCVAVTSGTIALQLALQSAGIGPGDRVVVPALTFIATANAVKAVGAEPVFIDVDRETWVINGEIPQCNGVIPVDLYGNPASGWHFFSETEVVHFAIVKDMTESLGSIGHSICCEDNVYSCYSFNGNKTMTTGGGGLVVGGNLDKVRELAQQGKYQSIGGNHRMPALNAALGLAQLKRLPEFIKKKKRFNYIYRNELDGLVEFQKPTPGSDPCWWMTACLFQSTSDKMRVALRLRNYGPSGIPTRSIFEPLPFLDAYNEWGDCKNAAYIFERGLCLPSSTKNTEKDIMTVCKAVKEIL